MKKTILSGATVLLLLMLLTSCKSKGKELPNLSTPPNIIYINVDDLGWKDVGYMGSTYFETPNIDKLSKEGMVFTQGYAAAANCAPSRACLMSGQNTPRHGVYTVSPSRRGNSKTRKIIPSSNTDHLTNAMVTMAEMFKTAGYTTGTFGKWHVTMDPINDGFDINFGGDHRGNPGRNGYTAPYNALPNLEKAPEGEHLTDRLTTEAINFIETNKDTPFFLYLPYYAVHTPLMGKEELIEKYKIKGGSQGQDNPVFAAMVENVDINIGRLLSIIEKLNLSNKTLIVFTSDNGGIRSISSQNPLRAGKGSYYEGGTRVPYIIKWPNTIKAGSTNATPIVNLDFFPTFMEILEVDLPNKILDGISILPLLKGNKIEERPLFWHFPIYLEAYNESKDDGRDPLFRTRPGSTILYKNWKLHHYFEDNALELYDLEKDLGERNNLVAINPEKAEELYNILDSWRKEVNAPIPSEPNPEYDPNY
ncbi:Arylsulfatase A [Arenibacter nanhaiticus]|uniref:Arylsulfatase A n=1 Tax=Arenibacter nanhaiticus TaxID=558155 RepID=A0A1M6CAQ8_9FLAO|nr:sulfatase [Arenibacter nanhaiticus]SHI57874.1 Arylsulfatase A [Arenibacter nanhaiticus]